jgi:hypothetical protein
MKELRTAVPFFMQADSLCTALFPKDQSIPGSLIIRSFTRFRPGRSGPDKNLL